MKKILLPIITGIVISIGIASCGDQPSKPSNNLEVVIHEYPNSIIYSEKPDKDLQDWIVLKDNQIFSVHVVNMKVEYTYLLSVRYDPNNLPQVDTTKAAVAAKVDTIKADTTIKIGTTKH